MTTFMEKYGSSPLPSAKLDALRQNVLDRLTEAFASDRVSLESYESRVGLAQSAETAGDLDEAMAGIEMPRARESGDGLAEPRHRSPSSTRDSRAPNRIDRSLTGQFGIACVMGDRQLSGDWLSGDQIGSFTLMGSTRIDLRDTALPPGRLKIDAFCVMGETKIIVPRHLPVRINAFPLMGEARAGRDVRTRVVPGEPYVEVNGLALMGSLIVVAMD